MPLLNIDHSALIVIDVQEAFRAAISDFPQIAARAATAVAGFRVLDVPVFVTEQYPKGLGPTASEIMLALPDDFAMIEKTKFSACVGELTAGLSARGVRQAVLCGVETHVCVNQTAHELLAAGFEVHLLTDAVGSRYAADKDAGLRKMFAAGVIASSVEMALFELMRHAGHEKFKEVQALVK